MQATDLRFSFLSCLAHTFETGGEIGKQIIDILEPGVNTHQATLGQGGDATLQLAFADEAFMPAP